MKQLILAIACILAATAMDAQTVSRTTVDQYRQMVSTCTGGDVPHHRQTFQQCNDRLEKWGFTYNRSGVVDMYTVHMYPFFRKEGEDTVGCMLATADDAVTSVSGIFTSKEASHTFALLAGAAELQESIANERGMTKFVCSVKGNVKNKFPKNVAELKEVLAEAGVDNVKWVFVSWESADRKQVATMIYDNKIYGKKKPKVSDRVELTLSVSDSRDLR